MPYPDSSAAPELPEAAIEVAARALAQRDNRSWSVMAETDREQYRDAARAAHVTEQAVIREQVARDIEARMGRDPLADFGLEHAARIARGGGA